MSWDQLAQRNLQFTAVDNPGPAATHRAPQTFNILPSKAIGLPGGLGLPPAEPKIDWGNVPTGPPAPSYSPASASADTIAPPRICAGATSTSPSHAPTPATQRLRRP